MKGGGKNGSKGRMSRLKFGAGSRKSKKVEYFDCESEIEFILSRSKEIYLNLEEFE